MEAIKKQASKLREQVVKQHQAILGQFGHLGNEAATFDDAELQCQELLQNLYNSTRAAKHFQRDIVHGVEGLTSASKKQMEIARKLAEDCCNYGAENQIIETPLARAAFMFGTSHRSMENERETMLRIIGSQVIEDLSSCNLKREVSGMELLWPMGRRVSEPLQASIKGAPLEDARHLTHCYDRFCKEVETQAAEVIRRKKSKFKDPSASAESSMKLQNAERKLNELRSAMMALGREAIAAMLSVEDKQQRFTFQKLRAMVVAEKSYHQNVITNLDELHAEMIVEKQLSESSSRPVAMKRDVCVPPVHDETTSNGPGGLVDGNQDGSYFISKVIHSFDAQAEGELSISVDDYVVVHQVAPNGWSEGECKGYTGWFPSAYVETQDEAPASNKTEASSSS